MDTVLCEQKKPAPNNEAAEIDEAGWRTILGAFETKPPEEWHIAAMQEILKNLKKRGNVPTEAKVLLTQRFPGQSQINTHLQHSGIPYRLLQIGDRRAHIDKERKLALVRVNPPGSR